MRVSLMVTCLGDALFPEVGVATVRLLRRLGVEVDFPPAQTCCGQPHFNSGFRDAARDLARHTIEAFDSDRLVGGGDGRKLATVAAAVGGGFAGNEVEKRTRSTTTYEVRVRMEDGSTRNFNQSGQPGWRAGPYVGYCD